MTEQAATTTLDGVLVVDLSRYLPGPFATRELERLGAEVVRLEAPSGDPLRMFAPAWHDWLNAGKQSVVCDLKEDPELGRSLCAQADVVVEGFRPGVVERLGVGPEQLPDSVVYCSIRGFAEGTAWSDRVGHDLNYLALAGVLDAESPVHLPLPFADLAAGALTAVARILGGLYRRERTGLGTVERIAMTDEAHRLGAYRRAGNAIVPRILEGGLACYDLYQTADGRWLSLGALEESFFRRLCEKLDLADLADRQFDPSAQDEIRGRLATTFGGRRLSEWLDELASEDVAVAPVLTADEAAHPDDGIESRRSPDLGEHTEVWRARLGDRKAR